MAKLAIKKGSTDVTVYVFIQDTSSASGAGLTGLVFNSAGLTAYYVRPLAAAAQLTLATLAAVTTAHSDGGFKEIDATNMPGVYRLDLSDAIVASGVNSVVVMLKGATNMLATLLEIELVAYDPQDTVRLGLTALPNAAAEAAGGIYTRGTGAGQINQPANGLIDANVEQWNATAVPAEHSSGYPIVTVKDGTGTGEINTDAGKIVEVSTLTGHTAQTGDAFARLGAPAGASVSADILAIDNLVDDLESRVGTPSNLGGGATIAANLSDIEAQTDDIGTAGAGLTAVPWNAAWDAEVQSEVQDAVEANRLDELLAADSDIDGAAPPTVGSVVHEMLSKTAGSFTFDQTTDSLEAIRDKAVDVETDTQDIQTKIGSPAGASLAADVAAIEAQTDDIGAAGAGLSGIPWNAAWDAEVQSEVADALAVYDPPTHAELQSEINDVQTDVAAVLLRLQGLVMAQGTIGSTGNDTTHIHLTGLTYGDDEINDLLLVIRDVSASEYHARWIADWADTGDLATVATLPFTPESATDTYWLLPIRKDVTSAAGLDAAGVRAAVGLASANLDTQLGAIDDAVDTEVAAVLAAVDTEVAAIKAKTDNLPATPAAVGSQMTLEDSAITAAKIAADAITAAKIATGAIDADALAADAIAEFWTTALTEAYAADGAAPTAAQALFAILQVLTESSISGTTWTVKKLDGSTTALVLTINSSSAPTSVTRSG